MKAVYLDTLQKECQKKDVCLVEGFTNSGKTKILKELFHSLPHKGASQRIEFAMHKVRWNAMWQDPVLCADMLLAQAKKASTLYVCIDNLHMLPNPLSFLSRVYEEVRGRSSLTLRIVASSSMHLSQKEELKQTANDPHLPFSLERFRFYDVSWFRFAGTKCLPASVRPDTRIAPTDTERLEKLHTALSHKKTVALFESFVLSGVPEKDTDKPMTQSVLEHHLDNVIVQRTGLKQAAKSLNTAKQLILYISTPIQRQKIAKEANQKIHVTKRLMSTLEHGLLFDFIPPFFTDQRYETSKRRIPYCVDHVFLPLIRETAGEEHPAIDTPLLYNFVYTEILKQHAVDHIFFYRLTTGKVLPFVLERKGKLIPVDVQFSTQAKAHSALRSFQKRYAKDIDYSICITRDTFDKSEGVLFVPIYLFPFLDLST